MRYGGGAFQVAVAASANQRVARYHRRFVPLAPGHARRKLPDPRLRAYIAPDIS